MMMITMMMTMMISDVYNI